jgi:hypothetical protein
LVACVACGKCNEPESGNNISVKQQPHFDQQTNPLAITSNNINRQSMGYSTSNKLRPLNIKFDVYSDGDDNEFKSELLSLMKGSVLELQSAAVTSFNLRNADIFRKAAHKAKSTLVLLDDTEFFSAVEEFKEQVVEFEGKNTNELNSCKIDKLNELCDSIVESLEKEAEHLRSS